MFVVGFSERGIEFIAFLNYQILSKTMEKHIGDTFRLLLPIGRTKRMNLKLLAGYITEKELKDVKYLTRLHRIGFFHERFETSETLFPDRSWPQLTLAVNDEEIKVIVERINKKVRDSAMINAFKEFRKDAIERISKLLANNLLGLEAEKRVATVQLFSQESLHILLIGDPGTGKTDILRAVEHLAPHAVFGLGSGASKAGLIGIYEGETFHKGLLVAADEGIALIDELNLLKKEDRAGLYSAMEKGFITYDKKGKHERFNARIRILATANPKGDRFVGKDAKFLKTQLPFDEALLSRFHFVFMIRKPNKKKLEMITRKIVRNEVNNLSDGDARFVKAYVQYAEKLDVLFDKRYESMIIDFIDEMKTKEKHLLTSVGPRTVLGVIRTAKAFARARLSHHTNADDVEEAIKLMKSAYENI